MKQLTATPTILFALFIILGLSTPSWRYGPFSWLPLWSFDHLAGGPVKLGLLNLVPLLLLITWLILQRRQRRWRWGPRAITLPMAAFSLWALLRLEGAPFRLLFIYGGDFLLLWLTYLFFLNRRPPLRPILATVVVIQATVGIMQFLAQADLGLIILGELPLNPAFEGVTVLQARGVAWLRAYGLTAHPNLYGALLALCLLLIVVARGQRPRLLAPVMWPVLGLGAAGLFFSFSRTAWLGAGLGFAVWVILMRLGKVGAVKRSSWWLLLPVLVAAIAFLAYGDLVLSRFSNLDQPLEAQSISQRLYDARLAVQLARQNPAFGVGLGMNVDAASLLGDNAQRVHNVLLLAVAELGIPGLILVIWLLLAPVIAFLPLLRQREYTPAANGLAPWMAILIVNQLDTTLWLTGNWQTALLFALAAANAATYLPVASTERAQTLERAPAARSV